MPTRYAGTARERQALDAWIKINRATDTVGHVLTEGLAAEGSSHAQLAVLEALHFVGPLCQADLGRKLLRSGANMTELVDSLERRGLVARRRDSADRRRVEVHLTDEGTALITALFPAHARRIAEAFSVLTQAEQRELARLCKKLGTGLAERQTPDDKPHKDRR